MAEADKILVKVDVDVAQTAQRLQEVNTAIKTVKDSQKLLEKSIRETGDATGELSAEYARNAEDLKLLTAEQKALNGQLATSIDTNTELGDSFRELDAKCRALENTYKTLTKAQRESAEGQQLKEKLIETKQALKDFDAELGNHQRNVGNYPQTWMSAIPGMDKAGRVLSGLGVTMQDVSAKGVKAFSGLGQSVKALGKAFITPPIVIITAVVAAVLLVFNKLKEAFEKNDDAMTALQRAMAAFEPIGEAIRAIFDALAQAIGKVVEAAANAVTWIADKLSPAYAKAKEEAQGLVDAQDKLQDAERKYTEDSAKRNRDVAKLRSEAMDKERYNVQERRKMLQQAVNLEKANLAEEKKIKAEHLRILEETARKERDTSDETKNKIAAARAAMYQAEQNYFTGVRSLQKQLNSFDKEEAAEEQRRAAEAAAAAKAAAEERKRRAKEQAEAAKRAAEERKQRAKEQAEAEKNYQDQRVQIAKEAEDALLAVEQDGLTKQLAQIQLATNREIAALEKRRDALRKNDVQARDNINAIIAAKEQAAQEQMTALIIRDEEQRAAKIRSIEQARADLGIRDEEVLAQRRLERAQEAGDRLRALTDEQRKALYADQQAYDEAILAADTELYNAREAVQQAYYDRTEQAEANDWERRKQAAVDNEVELARIELEQATAEQEALVNMDAETKARLYANEEQYVAAMIAAENRLKDASKATTEAQIKDAETKVAAVSGMTSALTNLLDQFGEENKAAAKASKVLALGQIAVETGMAIAKGITQAQSVPFPANIAAIATTITSVLGGIASAIASVKSAKFAQGGIVGGNSYTGDRVPILANSREMIINPDQQTTLFKALSGGDSKSQSLGIDYGKMAAAMASTPAPVMVLKELHDFEDNVATYNEIAGI